MPRAEDTDLWYKRIEHFNLPGHVHFLTFSCYRRMPLLTNYLWCSWLAESIKLSLKRHDIALWAYVFMPEHVHLLVRPRSAVYDISSFLKSVKNSSSKRILHELRRPRCSILNGSEKRLPEGQGLRRFWQAGPGYDKNIWTLEKAVEKANYCHRNPVTRGLVTDPAEWKWSSYRSLELGEMEGAPLAVNSWYEGRT